MAAAADFHRTIEPMLQKYCYECHGDGSHKGKVAFDELSDADLTAKPELWLTALKNVSGNEEFFQGHFPGHPVMPGVLIIESMAQACGMLVKLSVPKERQHEGVFYLVKVDKARFNRVVVPGDQLRLEVQQKRLMRNMSLFECQALVDGAVAAQAELLCAEVAR